MEDDRRASPVWPKRVRHGTAAILAVAGVLKVGDAPVMKRQFAAWGYSAGFRRAVGVTELVTSALIASSRTRPAVTLLAVLMGGAAMTHLKTPGQRMLAPGPLMFFAAYIVAVRYAPR